MTDQDPTPMALCSLYLATAEKVSDRRAAANAWMLSVNSAIVGLYGYLAQGEASVDEPERAVWQWAIPVAGALVCIAWAALLKSYSQLNSAKFEVLQEIENAFPHRLFYREWLHYREGGRRRLSEIESWVPWSFVALYAAILIASVHGAAY